MNNEKWWLLCYYIVGSYKNCDYYFIPIWGWRTAKRAYKKKLKMLLYGRFLSVFDLAEIFSSAQERKRDETTSILMNDVKKKELFIKNSDKTKAIKP